MKFNRIAASSFAIALLSVTVALPAERWTVEQVGQWGDLAGVVRGCNYLPSTAGNSTEIWQAVDWREEVIDRELKLAANTGLNSVRVFVQYLIWEREAEALLRRMDRFLAIADSHHIRTMWVLFDDCAFGYPPKTDPYLGPPGDPMPQTWMCDVLRPDGTPYDTKEMELVRSFRFDPQACSPFDRRVTRP